MFEQHETVTGIFAERTVPGGHKHLHKQYERGSYQGLQSGDSRAVGGGR